MMALSMPAATVGPVSRSRTCTEAEINNCITIGIPFQQRGSCMVACTNSSHEVIAEECAARLVCLCRAVKRWIVLFKRHPYAHKAQGRERDRKSSVLYGKR